MNTLRFFSLGFVVALALTASACSPIGVAAGAGATLGIASAKEGGISGAASDLRIKTLISERWFSYKIDTFRQLNLTVDQGRVLITGIVQSPDDRVEAVRLAWQVSGVKQVINEIRVADSEGVSGFVKDTWITTRLRTAMTFDKDIDAINYSIDTVDGTVYLMGVSKSQKELDKTISLARTISGVRQVVSYVKPAGQPVATNTVGSNVTQPVMTEPTASSQPQPVMDTSAQNTNGQGGVVWMSPESETSASGQAATSAPVSTTPNASPDSTIIEDAPGLVKR